MKSKAQFGCVALLAAAVLLQTPVVSAGGLIGDALENACGGCGIGRAADQLNDRLGNPVDHTAAAVANYYVPGSGAVIEGYYQYQRQPQCVTQYAQQYDQYGRSYTVPVQQCY